MDKLDELIKIKELLDSGIITEKEFDELKNKIIKLDFTNKASENNSSKFKTCTNCNSLLKNNESICKNCANKINFSKSKEKKRIIIYLLLLISLSIGSFVYYNNSYGKRKVKNDLEIENLKGMVKTISTTLETKFLYADLLEKGHSTLKKYNVDGYEIYRNDLNNLGGDDGEFQNDITETKRDINNNKLQENTEIISCSDNNSPKKSSIIYGYNTDNYLIKKVTLNDGVIENEINYVNDDNGNIIKEIGNPYKNLFIYKYDDDNNLVEEESSVSKTIYKYSDFGKIISETMVERTGKVILTRIYKYNSKGNLIFEFDDKITNGTSYKYDLKNNLIEKKNSQASTKYNYDDYGNWISEIIDYGDYQYITKRNIDYYSENEIKSKKHTNVLLNSKQNNTNKISNFNSTDEFNKIISLSDIKGKTSFELKIMRNEIFARHGYIFKTVDMKEYFNKQTWYSPKYEDVSSKLSTIEKKNIEFLKSNER